MTDGMPVVAGYTNLAPIGRGGFSTVYRADHERLGRSVALKVLHTDVHDDDDRRRVDRECRVGGRVSGHPNIATVLETGVTADGRPYITSTFYANGSLADRLRTTGPLPVADVLEIGVKLAATLAYLHSAGVMHRDIKPQNILMSEFGEPALADFGVSTIMQGGGLTTATGALTPLHAPPESFDDAAPAPSADIFSLGSTLYTLLAGRAPFQGDTGDTVLGFLRQLLERPAPPIGRDDVPPGVEAVLGRAMAKAPSDRFANGLDLAEALRAEQAAQGFVLTPLGLGPDTIDAIRARTAADHDAADATDAVDQPTLGPARRSRIASPLSAARGPVASPWSVVGAAHVDRDASDTGRVARVRPAPADDPDRGRLAAIAIVLAVLLLGGAIAGFAWRGSTDVAAPDGLRTTETAAPGGTIPPAHATGSVSPGTVLGDGTGGGADAGDVAATDVADGGDLGGDERRGAGAGDAPGVVGPGAIAEPGGGPAGGAGPVGPASGGGVVASTPTTARTAIAVPTTRATSPTTSLAPTTTKPAAAPTTYVFGIGPNHANQTLLVSTEGRRLYARTRLGAGNWSARAPLGDPAPGGASFSGKAAVARNPDGRVEVFAVVGGRVHHAWQEVAGGAFGGWQAMDIGAQSTGFVGGVAVAINQQNVLEVFAVAADGSVRHAWQTIGSGTGWDGWHTIDGASLTANSIAAATNGVGLIEVFGLSSDRTVWHAYQRPGTATGWSTWGQMPGVGSATALATALNPDGRLELFMTALDSTVWHIWQNAPGSEWAAWSPFGGALRNSIQLVNADGRLEVVGGGTDGLPYYARQNGSVGSGWTPWTRF